MNLPDLISRKDRAVALDSGSAKAMNIGLPGQRMRAVELAPGTVLRLKEAFTFNVLSNFPNNINWKVESGFGIRIKTVSETRSSIISESKISQRILLKWPTWVRYGHYDLIIEALGDTPVTISVGKLLDPRLGMRSRITGTGLELGPGLTPRIFPADHINIEYVEERHPEEWLRVYGNGNASMEHLTPDVLARYRVGSAITLEEWPDKSLDFIFSNHVFEHLPNPLQVLRNWLSKIKTGGSILAVIPDTRFTFDLRQKTSSIEDILLEEKNGGYIIGDDKYRRWCEFTAPYNTIENLKERKYSIHVHYYTPRLIEEICNMMISLGEFSKFDLYTDKNNKEFGLAIVK